MAEPTQSTCTSDNDQEVDEILECYSSGEPLSIDDFGAGGVVVDDDELHMTRGCEERQCFNEHHDEVKCVVGGRCSLHDGDRKLASRLVAEDACYEDGVDHVAEGRFSICDVGMRSEVKRVVEGRCNPYDEDQSEGNHGTAGRYNRHDEDEGAANHGTTGRHDDDDHKPTTTRTVKPPRIQTNLLEPPPRLCNLPTTPIEAISPPQSLMKVLVSTVTDDEDGSTPWRHPTPVSLVEGVGEPLGECRRRGWSVVGDGERDNCCGVVRGAGSEGEVSERRLKLDTPLSAADSTPSLTETRSLCEGALSASLTSTRSLREGGLSATFSRNSADATKPISITTAYPTTSTRHDASSAFSRDPTVQTPFIIDPDAITPTSNDTTTSDTSSLTPSTASSSTRQFRNSLLTFFSTLSDASPRSSETSDDDHLLSHRDVAPIPLSMHRSAGKLESGRWGLEERGGGWVFWCGVGGARGVEGWGEQVFCLAVYFIFWG
ncbi:hypothetical protein HDU67_006137 [Dinochytrium kinnereticum]|nr:hypothetical protein HDU67_006137 [Dinochytrium kinnereticum]